MIEDNIVYIDHTRFILDPPHTVDSVQADIAWSKEHKPWQCAIHHSREVIGSRAVRDGEPYESLVRCRRCHRIEPLG